MLCLPNYSPQKIEEPETELLLRRTESLASWLVRILLRCLSFLNDTGRTVLLGTYNSTVRKPTDLGANLDFGCHFPGFRPPSSADPFRASREDVTLMIPSKFCFACPEYPLLCIGTVNLSLSEYERVVIFRYHLSHMRRYLQAFLEGKSATVCFQVM